MLGSAADPGDASPPARRRPAAESELGFVRRPMVRWLDPHQLMDTAIRVLVSGVFSSYADRRDLQALEPAEIPDRSRGREIWIDYVSDLGDGWNSTYTVARLLAAADLKLDWEGEALSTERGRILVMGGDQVYPVPKAAEYENRLLGPYRCALPAAPDDAPELFAIPGSHDWYDGLVNFTSIFCHGHSIGGWRSTQRRSYFAVRLPAGWWLWGIDIQFGDFIDEPQVQYFARAAEQFEPGDRVILCTAKHVDSGRKQAEVHSDRDVGYLERSIIRPAGASVALNLKSGKHHYARYATADGSRHQVTAGGGGAFLHPTHTLPEELVLPGPSPATAALRTTYPSAKVSRRLRKRIWLLPPYNLPLAALLGTVQVLLAFMMGLHLHDGHRSLDLDGLRRGVWESPTAFVLILLMVVSLTAMVRFAHEARGMRRLLLGSVHSALQLAGVAAVMIGASHLASGTGLRGAWSLVSFLGLTFVLGGIGGTVGMSAYLWATNLLGLHGNEGYAPLHHQDLKNFLRLRIGEDGALTVFPVGIDRVGRRWRLCPEAPDAAPWFAPVGPEPVPHLIEAPIRIAGRPRT